MTPYIQNVGAAEVADGNHYACGENSMLIQIADVDIKTHQYWTTPYIPTPKHKFKEVHLFQFLDIEKGDRCWEQYGIQDEQAKKIVELLSHALENRMNVVVHCFAGICRSGAVAEVGTMMGFRIIDGYRQPNLLVKHKLMRELGWTYDEVTNITVKEERK